MKEQRIEVLITVIPSWDGKGQHIDATVFSTRYHAQKCGDALAKRCPGLQYHVVARLLDVAADVHQLAQEI